VCPFVHSFGSVSKLDSESNPLLMCGTFEQASVLNQSCFPLFSHVIRGMPKETEDPTMVVPYWSLRQFVPLLLRLLLEAEVDRRVSQGGDLYAAAQSTNDHAKPVSEEKWKGKDNVQVVLSLVQGGLVHICQPGNGNESSLSVTFPKFALALQALASTYLWHDRVFFLCLLAVMIKHKSKLPKATRDAVVRSWLDWLQQEGSDDGGSMTSAAHEYLITLLNEWSSLGNLLLPRDDLVEFATEAVEAVNASEGASSDRKFASMWAKDEKDFEPIRKQYERMLKHLLPARAKEWKQEMGIETEESADDSPS
jgi:hypothetical protein